MADEIGALHLTRYLALVPSSQFVQFQIGVEARRVEREGTSMPDAFLTTHVQLSCSLSINLSTHHCNFTAAAIFQ